MVNFLLNSGLTSVTFWAALVTFTVVLISWFRSRPTEDRLAGSSLFWFLMSSTLFLLFLGFGTTVNFGLGLYKSYVAPRDLMQDIVSAQEFLGGRSLYPDPMNPLMKKALEAEPQQWSLFWWSPELLAQEAENREQVYKDPWVQAHPPQMTLFVSPFVALGGLRGTWLAMSIISIVMLFLSLYLIEIGLGLKLSRRHRIMLVLAVLGAAPMVSVFRLGQTGLLLGGLMILTWHGVRKDNPVLAGIALGLATSLKLYPGLFFCYLLIRNRKAFLVGMVTMILTAAYTAIMVGWSAFPEFMTTSRGVIQVYENYFSNISLLGVLARMGPESPGPVSPFRYLFFGTMAAALILSLRLIGKVGSEPPPSGNLINLEMGLFMALIPLLSPIAWDHYLSVLLLPLAIVGSRALSRFAPWATAIGYLAIVVVLCTPDTTFTTLYGLLPTELTQLGNLGILSLRTYALIALVLWMVNLIKQEQIHFERSLQGRAPTV